MIVIVDPDQPFRAQLASDLGRANLKELAQTSELDPALMGSGEVSVVVMGPHVEPADALGTAEALRRSAPAVSVLLVADEVTPELLRQAMRAGVEDVIATASTNEIRDGVNRAEGLARHAQGGTEPAQDPGRPHRMVTVFSSKGGCGKSVVAANLGVLLADRTGQDVALVDLDLESGDLSIMLGLLPAWTIYDAAENIDRLNAEVLRGYLTPHPSRVSLLAAPLDPALAGAIPAEAVRSILRLLAESHSYVLIDGPCSFTDALLVALDESDLCILVGSMDVPSIKNLKLALGALSQLGFPRGRIRVVISRSDSKVGLNLGEVEKTLGCPIDVAIPSSRDVPLSVNQGVPLAIRDRRSPIVSAIAGLLDAVKLPSEPNPTGRKARRSNR